VHQSHVTPHHIVTRAHVTTICATSLHTTDNLFTGCTNATTCTIILRGGSSQFIAESERSLHDALMIVKRALTYGEVVGGGGAIEMELSRFLREYARTLKDKGQLVVAAFAQALEVIPRQVGLV